MKHNKYTSNLSAQIIFCSTKIPSFPFISYFNVRFYFKFQCALSSTFDYWTLIQLFTRFNQTHNDVHSSENDRPRHFYTVTFSALGGGISTLLWW